MVPFQLKRGNFKTFDASNRLIFICVALSLLRPHAHIFYYDDILLLDFYLKLEKCQEFRLQLSPILVVSLSFAQSPYDALWHVWGIPFTFRIH